MTDLSQKECFITWLSSDLSSMMEVIFHSLDYTVLFLIKFLRNAIIYVHVSIMITTVFENFETMQ